MSTPADHKGTPAAESRFFPAVHGSPTGPASDRSTRLFRSLVLLLVFAGALFVFIALLGDWRREHNIVTRLEEYATIYASRQGEGGVLPLNLELAVPRDPRSRLIEGWISPAEAASLREGSEPVLAAWTVPIIRALGRDGRAVIVFAEGRFVVRWVSSAEFAALSAAQSDRIQASRKPPQGGTP